MKQFILAAAMLSVMTFPTTAESYTAQQYEDFLGANCPSARHLQVSANGVVTRSDSFMRDNSAAIRKCIVDALNYLAVHSPYPGPRQTDKVGVRPSGRITIGYK